jgi:inosose dehydratase
MISRRGFLASSLVLPAAASASPGPRLLAQAYVFTQEFSRRKISLADGIDEMFATVHDAGFRGMELMSQFFAADVRERTIASARKHSVAVPITYSGGAMHTTEGAAKAIPSIVALAEAAAAAGTIAINHNPDPIGRAKTDDELTLQAANLNRLGEALKKSGKELFVHHHNPEMAGGAREWRHILTHTDPALVSLCIDTHWIFRGDQEVMPIVREAGRRIKSIHLRNSVGKVWSESLGEGDIDYRPLSAYLKQEQLTPFLVVELAYESGTPHTRPLGENLRLGREYAERVFGVRA